MNDFHWCIFCKKSMSVSESEWRCDGWYCKECASKVKGAMMDTTKVRLHNKDFTVVELEKLLQDVNRLVNPEKMTGLGDKDFGLYKRSLLNLIQQQIKGIVIAPDMIMWSWSMSVRLNPISQREAEFINRMMRDPATVDELAKRFAEMCTDTMNRKYTDHCIESMEK